MSPLLTALTQQVTRDGARGAARRELSKRIYREDRPSLVARALRWVGDRIAELLNGLTGSAGGRLLGVLLVVGVVIALLVAIRLRSGPLARSGAVFRAAALERPRTAAEHRAEADLLAAAGDFAGAVRERMRALARELEDRGVLDPRLGRTAREVAGQAGTAVPTLAEDLRRAARVFDETWYGGRPATADEDATLREVDARVQAARLTVMTGAR